MNRILTAVIGAMILAVSVSAEKIGEVRSTDIIAFVDGSPIESYNYNDSTYIVATDLRNYGFDVEWDEAARRVDITREERAFTPYIADFVNKQTTYPLFVPMFDVYSTDIVTYINGEQVESCNVGGKTMIPFAELDTFGICTYNDTSRECDIRIFDNEIEECEKKETENGDINSEFSYVSEQGFFENNKFIYGKRKILDSKIDWTSTESISSSHLSSRDEQGDFTEGRIVAFDLDNKRSVEYFIECITPEKSACLLPDGNFRYKMRINRETYSDGTVRQFLTDSGMGESGLLGYEINGDNGKLYKDGELVYTGKMEKKVYTLNLTGDGEEKFTVLYAPDYSDENGIIYYMPEEPYEPCRIFFRGRVENGVAVHGEIYANKKEKIVEHDKYKRYDVETDWWNEMPIMNTTLLYGGYFKDGLPHALGFAYKDGYMACRGFYESGKLTHGVIFTQFNDGVYCSYAGSFENGVRSGEGREYDEDLYLCFEGEWKNGEPYSGKWYNQGEIYYEGMADEMHEEKGAD